jgi:hypothetical protein
MNIQGNQSEVARFIEQWDAEMEALQRALHGFAANFSQHEFITHRMDTFLAKAPLPVDTLGNIASPIGATPTEH